MDNNLDYYNKSLAALALFQSINCFLSLFTLNYEKLNLSTFNGWLNFIVSVGALVYTVLSAFEKPPDLRSHPCVKEILDDIKKLKEKVSDIEELLSSIQGSIHNSFKTSCALIIKK